MQGYAECGVERSYVLNSGQRKEAPNCQGAGSHYKCSQVEMVEITHYSSRACSAVCSDVDNGDVSSDIACTASISELISTVFLSNLLPSLPE